MRRWLLAAPLAALALASCGGEDEPAAPGEDRFDARRAYGDLEAQVEIGPRPSGTAGGGEEVDFITRALREAGLEDIRVQRPWRNVVATIPGNQPGVVIVAAHHDTKDAIPGFVGANDGASGVALVLELARGLAGDAPLDGPSVQVVLFDAEEARGNRDFEIDGLRGSLQYVDYAQRGEQGAVPLDEIRAMVLFDMIGDCDLDIPREPLSDRALYDEFADASVEVNAEPAPFEGTTGGVLDDHVPFRDQGIPAVDFIDFAYGPGPSPGPYWHTADDTLDKVCPESLDAVGEAAMRAIPQIR